MSESDEIGEETKICRACECKLPLSAFGKHSTSKDGIRAQCKCCLRDRRKKYQKEENARSREYYYRNQTALANDKLQRNYGITLTDYDEMLESQGGGCAICGRTPEENNKRLSVDHDHETNEIRGLLCRLCNTAIGQLGDSSEVCRRAVLYLREHGR